MKQANDKTKEKGMRFKLILGLLILAFGLSGCEYSSEETAAPPAAPSKWVNSGDAAITPVGGKSVIIGSEDSFAVDTDGDGDADYIFISTVPTTAADTCTTGTIVFDDTYIYRCVSTDTWKRASMATW